MTGTADVARTAFRPGAGVTMEALASGWLRGDPETGCLWYDSTGGPVAVLVQHDTAQVDFAASPPVIRDGANVLARLGQKVWMTGGHVPPRLAGGTVDRCPVQSERIFLTGGFSTTAPTVADG